MGHNIDQNNHIRIDPPHSPNTFGARVDQKKRELFAELAAIIPDTEAARHVEALVHSFLIDMEHLHFTLGLHMGAAITADHMREEQSKADCRE